MYSAENAAQWGGFVDTPYGAGLLAESARESACIQGASWAADKVARITFAAAMWLLGNKHPAGSSIRAQITYNVITRMLVVNVDDDGTAIPGQQGTGDLPEAEWRAGAELPRLQTLVLRTTNGRRVQCIFRVREPHRIRITRTPDPRATQPLPWQTYQGHMSRDAAEWSARSVSMQMGRDGVCAVEIQGPEDPDDVWHPWDVSRDD